jgi:hypothetical protein
MRPIYVGAPERLPVFGARTFPTFITASVIRDLNEKIAGVDYPLRCMYRSRAGSIDGIPTFDLEECRAGMCGRGGGRG